MTSPAAAELLRAACETTTKPPPKRITNKADIRRSILRVMAFKSRMTDEGDAVGFSVWGIADMTMRSDKVEGFVCLNDVQAHIVKMTKGKKPLVYNPLNYDHRFFALTQNGLLVAARAVKRN